MDPMDLFLLLYILLSTPFGIWLAFQRNFLIIPNRKYNIFTIRLIFTVPFSISVVCFVSSLILGVIYCLSENLTNAIVEMFGSNVSLVSPALTNFLFIYYYKRSWVPKIEPCELRPDFMFHSLYLFNPAVYELYTLDTMSSLITKNGSDWFFKKYKKDIRFYNGMSFSSGHIIVTEEGLTLLKNNGITGFLASPVGNVSDFQTHPGGKIYKIDVQNKLPEMASQTTFVVKKYSTKLKNNYVAYNSNDLSDLYDMNETREEIGYVNSNFGTKNVLSKKMMKLMINEFGYGKRDFIPIHLIHD